MKEQAYDGLKGIATWVIKQLLLMIDFILFYLIMYERARDYLENLLLKLIQTRTVRYKSSKAKKVKFVYDFE